jgi:nucleotide-binding universal stress UspA family protein
MKSLSIASERPELGVRASHAAPVIIGSDGQAQSDSALVVGRLMAGAEQALHLVTVLKPLPSVSEVPIAITADALAARQAEARREVVAQAARLWGESCDVELYEGDPAAELSHLAHETGARMIVCGLGRHRLADRVLGDETALRLVRLADVPVLAVARNFTHAPRRIVVAADFSETSLRAARLALELASPNATMYLTHVAPRDSSLYDWKSWDATYKQDAGAALQKTHDQLRVPRGMAVQNILLQGDPATELLAFATSVNADLIATGSHGRGFMARLLIGSVATRVVRASTCSVLTVPHAAVMTNTRTTVQPSEVTLLAAAEWEPRLEELSRRNAGRRCTLEIDDPAIGAQAEIVDYPLLGATFDWHDERVELMFGDAERGGRHLMHAIGGVTSIEVLRNEKGEDVALRIAHGAGLTLLTFFS